MMLVESAVRLMVVVAVLIWLPGWLAVRRPLRTAAVLECLTIGTAIYLGVLVAATSLLQRTDSVTVAIVLGTCAAVALLTWQRIRLPDRTGDAHPLTIGGPLILVVSLCVVAAAVLRWFHNYHFDDFQHLVYLTEMEREGLLFPRSLMLHVEWGSLPDRALVVSRYPFWAAHIILFSRLAGVPVGDAYYVLGLLSLAFALTLITAMLRHVLSSNTGAVAGLAALLAGGHLLTADEILNFGGYPFQAGKLFVLIAAVACVAYLHSRRPVYLGYLAIALFAAPLMHTNNILGASVVVGGAAAAASVARSRALLLSASAPLVALLITTVMAVLTGGFLRYVTPADEAAAQPLASRTRSIAALPDNPGAHESALAARPGGRGGVVPTPIGRFDGYNIIHYDGWYYAVPDGSTVGPLDVASDTTAPGLFRSRTRAEVEREIATYRMATSGIDELAVGAPGNIRGRLALFVRRSLPLEILLVFALIGIHHGFGAAAARRLIIGLGAAFLIVVVAKSGVALVRQVATTTFKPGYLLMRSSLVTAGGLLGRADVLTDPITHVYGSAAGWPLHAPPPFSLHEQFIRLLIFHPDVQGDALRYLLGHDGRRLLIVNEAVLGPAVAAKFMDLGGLELVGQIGPTLPRPDMLEASAEAILERLYALDYAAVRDDPTVSGRVLWTMLFRRPLYVFVRSGGAVGVTHPGPFMPIQPYEAQPGKVSGWEPSFTARAHLNSVLLRADLPDGCFSQASISLEGTATFSSPVLVHVLPVGRAAAHWTVAAGVRPREVTTAPVVFLVPVCGPGTVTFFVHGDRLYDLRFRIHAVDWKRHEPPEVTSSH